MKKKLFVALVLALCLLLSGCTDGAITAREARNGVVRVLVTRRADLYSPTGEYLETRNVTPGVGSAFGVGDAGEETDVFVTNRHVVTSEPGIMQLESGELVLAVYETTGVYLVLDNFAYNLSTNELDTSRTVPCTVIYAGNEEEEDVAVLRASEPVPGRVALALQAEESSLREEDPVTALGYPFLSDEATNEGYLLATIDDMTVSPGYAMRFYEAQDVLADTGTGRVIQMSCVINGGNSGGPLVDENGAVVGINTWTFGVADPTVTGSYYAIRVQYAKNALDSLGIAYDVYTGGAPVLLIVAICAAVVLAAALVFALVIYPRWGGRKRAPAPAPQEELRIQCESGIFAGRRFELSGQVRMGRDPARNDLIFPEGTQGISGVHCVVAVQDGHVQLKDLGSTYGTFLRDGRRVAPGQAVELQVGDGFSLGSDRERFVITRKGGV